MKTYAITDKAGRYVAGTRNPGVGTTLTLTDKQAEAALRNGEIVEVEAAPETPFAVGTVTDTAVNPQGQVDSLPEAIDPDAPARAAGSATVQQAQDAAAEADAETPQADDTATATSSRKTASAAKKSGEASTTTTSAKTSTAPST